MPRGAPAATRSQELEKLLQSVTSLSGAPPAASASYDAEAMVDELLASTWEPLPSAMPTRKMSLSSSATPLAATSALARGASFKQQTRSMNELQSALADAIERLVKQRHVVSERIAALEKENQKASSKFHEGLRNPELLLTVSG